MLSEQELLVLLEMDRRLDDDDPAFAARCARLMSDRSYRWTVRGSDPAIGLWAVFGLVSSVALWASKRAGGRRERGW